MESPPGPSGWLAMVGARNSPSASTSRAPHAGRRSDWWSSRADPAIATTSERTWKACPAEPILGPSSRRRSLRRAVILLIGMMLASGCRSGAGKAIEAKCDAALRLHAQGLARAGDKGPLEVLGSAKGPIDEPQRRKLTEAGADLGQVTNELFTARIPTDRLGRVAVLDFVKSLQLSQQRDPLKP